MPGDWLAIRVELVGGRGMVFKPPGRVMLVGPRHTFGDLAGAINLAFARWDLSHLHEFRLSDGRRIGFADEEEPEVLEQTAFPVASTVRAGDEFEFVFDFGDDWTHRCRVLASDVDPREEAGTTPRKPTPVWGWGWLPDQYGREEDEGWEAQRFD
jgi:hypothetical protein